MLLSILDLERITVNDIMIPRTRLPASISRETGRTCSSAAPDTAHAPAGARWRPDNLIGILHMKRTAQEFARGTLTRERYRAAAAR